MESENSQYLWPCTSTPPPLQNPVERFIGSFVTLITNYDLRYEGVLYHLNLEESTLGLQNVICYGTEGRMNSTHGVQIPPSNLVYYYILFSRTDIKEIIVRPPSSFTCCPHPLILYNQPGAKMSKKLPHFYNEKLNKLQATQLWSDHVHESMPYGVLNQDPISQKLPLISNEKLNKTQATQLWSDHVHQSMPYGVLNQDPINAVTSSNLHDSSASYLTSGTSFFATFPPAPVSLPPIDGELNFEESTKNFIQYELWDRPQNKKEETAKPAYNTDRCSFKIWRNPCDHLGSPFNPFSPICEACEAYLATY